MLVVSSITKLISKYANDNCFTSSVFSHAKDRSDFHQRSLDKFLLLNIFTKPKSCSNKHRFIFIFIHILSTQSNYIKVFSNEMLNKLKYVFKVIFCSWKTISQLYQMTNYSVCNFTTDHSFTFYNTQVRWLK